MARMRTLVRLGVIGACGVLPAGAVAATARSARAPQSGAWKIEQLQGADDLAGSFTMHGTRITRFHGSIATGAETTCGTGDVALGQALTRFEAKGMNDEGGRYDEWAVGRNAPDADPVIQPIKVKVVHKGRTVSGSVWLVWRSSTLGNGELYYDRGQCDLQFLLKRS